MQQRFLPSIPVGRTAARRPFSLPQVRLSEGVREPALYAAAAVSYVAVGVFVTEFALSWVVGFSWLMLWVWGLPALVRRLRR